MVFELQERRRSSRHQRSNRRICRHGCRWHHRSNQSCARRPDRRSLGCLAADHHRSHDRRKAKGSCSSNARRHGRRRHGRHGFLIHALKRIKLNPGGDTGVFLTLSSLSCYCPVATLISPCDQRFSTAIFLISQTSPLRTRLTV
jgi:hypothetical protein